MGFLPKLRNVYKVIHLTYPGKNVPTYVTDAIGWAQFHTRCYGSKSSGNSKNKENKKNGKNSKRYLEKSKGQLSKRTFNRSNIFPVGLISNAHHKIALIPITLCPEKQNDEQVFHEALAVLSVLRDNSRQIELFLDNSTKLKLADKGGGREIIELEAHDGSEFWDAYAKDPDNQDPSSIMTTIYSKKNNAKSLLIGVPKWIESEIKDIPVSGMHLNFEMDMTNIKDALLNPEKMIKLPTKSNHLSDPTLALVVSLDSKETKTVPLQFNASINGTVDVNPKEFNKDKLNNLKIPEFNDYVTSIAANLCSTVLQKGFPTGISRQLYSTSQNDDQKEGSTPELYLDISKDEITNLFSKYDHQHQKNESALEMENIRRRGLGPESQDGQLIMNQIVADDTPIMLIDNPVNDIVKEFTDKYNQIKKELDGLVNSTPEAANEYLKVISSTAAVSSTGRCSSKQDKSGKKGGSGGGGGGGGGGGCKSSLSGGGSTRCQIFDINSKLGLMDCKLYQRAVKEATELRKKLGTTKKSAGRKSRKDGPPARSKAAPKKAAAKPQQKTTPQRSASAPPPTGVKKSKLVKKSASDPKLAAKEKEKTAGPALTAAQKRIQLRKAAQEQAKKDSKASKPPAKKDTKASKPPAKKGSSPCASRSGSSPCQSKASPKTAKSKPAPKKDASPCGSGAKSKPAPKKDASPCGSGAKSKTAQKKDASPCGSGAKSKTAQKKDASPCGSGAKSKTAQKKDASPCGSGAKSKTAQKKDASPCGSRAKSKPAPKKDASPCGSGAKSKTAQKKDSSPCASRSGSSPCQSTKSSSKKSKSKKAKKKKDASPCASKSGSSPCKSKSSSKKAKSKKSKKKDASPCASKSGSSPCKTQTSPKSSKSICGESPPCQKKTRPESKSSSTGKKPKTKCGGAPVGDITPKCPKGGKSKKDASPCASKSGSSPCKSKSSQQKSSSKGASPCASKSGASPCKSKPSPKTESPCKSSKKGASPCASKSGSSPCKTQTSPKSSKSICGESPPCQKKTRPESPSKSKCGRPPAGESKPSCKQGGSKDICKDKSPCKKSSSKTKDASPCGSKSGGALPCKSKLSIKKPKTKCGVIPSFPKKIMPEYKCKKPVSLKPVLKKAASPCASKSGATPCTSTSSFPKKTNTKPATKKSPAKSKCASKSKPCPSSSSVCSTKSKASKCGSKSKCGSDNEQKSEGSKNACQRAAKSKAKASGGEKPSSATKPKVKCGRPPTGDTKPKCKKSESSTKKCDPCSSKASKKSSSGSVKPSQPASSATGKPDDSSTKPKLFKNLCKTKPDKKGAHTLATLSTPFTVQHNTPSCYLLVSNKFQPIEQPQDSYDMKIKQPESLFIEEVSGLCSDDACYKVYAEIARECDMQEKEEHKILSDEALCRVGRAGKCIYPFRVPSNSFHQQRGHHSSVDRGNQESVIDGPCQVCKKTLALPPVFDNDVLVCVKSVALSDSDIYMFETGAKHYPDISLGHEAAGVVEMVGQKVYNLCVGDHVVIESSIPCGNCDLCKLGHYNICNNLTFNGCLRKYCAHPSAYCHKICKDIPMEHAALVHQIALACNACCTAGIKPNSNVAIIGSCAMTVCAAMCAQAMGAANVCVMCEMLNTQDIVQEFVTDKVERFDGKCKEKQIVRKILEGLGSFPDVVINCAGCTKTMNAAIMALKPRGTCVIASFLSECASFNIMEALMKEIRIIPSFRSRSMFPLAINLVESGRANVDCVLAGCCHWNQIEGAFQAALSEANNGPRKVVVQCQQGDDDNDRRR